MSGPPTTLKVSEYKFLITLGRNISKSNVALTNKLYDVIEQMKQTPQLTQPNYDFLVKLSKSLSNPQISERIQGIAQEHRPA